MTLIGLLLLIPHLLTPCISQTECQICSYSKLRVLYYSENSDTIEKVAVMKEPFKKLGEVREDKCGSNCDWLDISEATHSCPQQITESP